jgi:hypothetical protein
VHLCGKQTLIPYNILFCVEVLGWGCKVATSLGAARGVSL